MAIAKGTQVRQILPAPVAGVVTEFSVCQESGEVQVKVEWPDANGDGIVESRFFKLTEIEEVV